ncbi:PIN domain-containing protein [Microbacterium sp. No. 7]|uniref:PIN domain-containing protein n=1 Tax=Microbacterium sp. No. 7 TaxID=1714373 RepID=UPI000B0A9A20|nr:PIN domain-containing protein [Microbacterium sp. No. 7]
MTAALLDTSTVIALFQEQRRFTLEGFERVALSSLTYAELRLGVAMATTATVARQRMTAFETAREVFGDGIPFDDGAARAFGLIAARVADRGGDPKAHRTDRMIAAVAAAHDLTLVTLDAAGLRGLDSLVRVIEPPAA